MVKRILWMGGMLWALAPAAGRGQEDRAGLRDPFWPVGYRPPAAAVAAQPAAEDPVGGVLEFSNLSPEEQAMVRSHLKVSGIIRQADGRCIAIINREVMREGDMLPLTIRGRTYRFHIRSLTPQTVTLEPVLDEQETETGKEQKESRP